MFVTIIQLKEFDKCKFLVTWLFSQSLGPVTPDCIPPEFHDTVIFLELLWVRWEIQKHCTDVF